jgi:hypothetical protein
MIHFTTRLKLEDERGARAASSDRFENQKKAWNGAQFGQNRTDTTDHVDRKRNRAIWWIDDMHLAKIIRFYVSQQRFSGLVVPKRKK